MKRGLLILILHVLCSICTEARTGIEGIPRFTYGAEWSYTANIFKGYRCYFIAPEDGFRVDDRYDGLKYFTNGEVYVHAGYNFNEKWNLSIYSGYTTLCDFHPAIPISVRATRYFGPDPEKDRWFTYFDVGSGLSIQDKVSPILSAKVGGGYRISLSRYTKIDFIASIRFIHNRPSLYYYGEQIDDRYVDRNIGYSVAASLGIGITF